MMRVYDHLSQVLGKNDLLEESEEILRNSVDLRTKVLGVSSGRTVRMHHLGTPDLIQSYRSNTILP